jgi:hypothetical protein
MATMAFEPPPSKFARTQKKTRRPSVQGVEQTSAPWTGLTLHFNSPVGIFKA